jgi:hypothetical protein
MNVRIFCPRCDTPFSVPLPAPGPRECPACGNLADLAHPDPDPALPECAVCGNPELYKKKDFPHGLGMLILVGGFAVSTVFWWHYQIFLVWSVLIGTLLFDTLLYFLVGDVVACYRCGAEHRGIKPGPSHLPHEQTTEEKYRQQRLRQQELGRGSGPPR